MASLGLSEAAAGEIAPLRQHRDPRVRMYAVMARTVLGPRGPVEAKELIDLFDDPDEDMEVRCAATPCSVLFGEQAREAVPSLKNAIMDGYDPRCDSALGAFRQLEEEITGPLPATNYTVSISHEAPLSLDATRSEMAEFLLMNTDGACGWFQGGFRPVRVK